MDTQHRIGRVLRRLDQKGLATPALTLYAEGVKLKLRQARFSLEMLKELVHLEDQPSVQDVTTNPTAQNLLTVSEQINFYCDSFWDFLRSALDILGQFINELHGLSINERDVDFKRVADKIKSTTPDSPLQKALGKLRNSYTLGQLEAYRHCSTHRRQTYIETHKTTDTITGTPGYYSGSSVQQTRVERYLCTNPRDSTPRISGGRRPVVNYCESLLRRIENHIDTIVNRLT